MLYSITPWSIVYAVDAHTGKEVWHSDPEVNQQVWQSPHLLRRGESRHRHV